MNEITSVTQAIEIVNKLSTDDDFLAENVCHPSRFPFGIWFRGESNHDWSIEPGIFRSRTKSVATSHFFYDEMDLILHLKLRASKYLQTHRSALEWLCLAQHYSMPTRLLDWTESILFALYFAVRDDTHVTKDGKLICLNAKKLNFHTCGKGLIYDPQSFVALIRSEMAVARETTELRNKRSIREAIALGRLTETEVNNLEKYSAPIALFPYRANHRMIFQQSVFTLHGGKLYDEKSQTPVTEKLPLPVSLKDINQKINLLKVYIIPQKSKQQIEEELYRLGVHEGTLFPEIDRQAAYLKKAWARSS